MAGGEFLLGYESLSEQPLFGEAFFVRREKLPWDCRYARRPNENRVSQESEPRTPICA